MLDLGFLILISLTAGITIFVIILSVTLVLHKEVSRVRAAALMELIGDLSEAVSKYLTAEPPAVPEGSPASARIKAVASLLQPVRSVLASVPFGRRRLSRRALRRVAVDFTNDLEGESVERLVLLSYTLGVVPDVLSTLKDRRWWIRAEGARDLGYLRARRSIVGLTAALEDPHPTVQFQAMRSLLLIVGTPALRTLFRVGQTMNTWQMVELSTDILAYKDEAVPFLIEGLSAQDPSFVIFCVELLAQIGFVDAVEPLIGVARTGATPSIRAKAVEALGRLGDERGVSALIEHLGSDDSRLRFRAIEALERMKAPEAAGALFRCLCDGDLDEQIAAARALAAIGPAGGRLLDSLPSDRRSTAALAAAEAQEDRLFAERRGS